jgi:hypothetical protein
MNVDSRNRFIGVKQKMHLKILSLTPTFKETCTSKNRHTSEQHAGVLEKGLLLF